MAALASSNASPTNPHQPPRHRLHDLRHHVDRELRQREEQEGRLRRRGAERGDEEADVALTGGVAHDEALGRGEGAQDQHGAGEPHRREPEAVDEARHRDQHRALLEDLVAGQFGGRVVAEAEVHAALLVEAQALLAQLARYQTHLVQQRRLAQALHRHADAAQRLLREHAVHHAHAEDVEEADDLLAAQDLGPEVGPDDDPGWFFVIQQQPTEPRFGLDPVDPDDPSTYEDVGILRQITVGTAKPTQAERERVKHHFIDELDLTEPFSAGRFAEVASERIARILEQGRVPIVVGGSTLYIEALLHGLSDIPPTSAETRSQLMHRLRTEGADVLHHELRAVDPRSACTMDASKTQRIVRALEVYHDTGHLLSWYHAQQPEPRFNFVPVVLTRQRKTLYERINQRVDRMLDHGLLEENRRLLEYVGDTTPNPLRTIGYREPLAYLRGEIDYEEMVRLLKRNSRRYAKRQLTWFRRHDEYTWIRVDQQPDPVQTISSLMQASIQSDAV